MRRPLMAVCLCVILILAIRHRPWEETGERGVGPGYPQSGQRILATGQVCDKTTDSFVLGHIHYLSEDQKAADLQQAFPNKEKIICVPEEPRDLEQIGLGGVVVVSGVYYDYKRATSPGEFDPDAYYGTSLIRGQLRQAVLINGSKGKWPFREMLALLRVRWMDRLYEVYPEKEASIMATLLLGEKKGLDGEIKELYRRNGVLHILSISGLHISILGIGLYRLLRKVGMSPAPAAVISGCVLLAYGLLTGMSISTCRAIGMFLYRMLAEGMGRSYDRPTALGVTGMLILLENPGYFTSPGFLLSFGAVCGIILISPVMQEENSSGTKGFLWGKCMEKLRQNLAGSFAITVATLPVQLWFYYQVPTYAGFLNLLVLPLMGMLVLTGVVVMVIPGTGLFGTLNLWILQIYEWLCRAFDHLPWNTLRTGRPEATQVVIYLFLIALGVLQKKRGRGYWKSLFPLAVLVLCCRLPAPPVVTFLDVGQGDGIVMEMTPGQTFIMDCGSSTRKKVGENVLIPFLKYRGITCLRGIFVSHADTDHYNGIVELLHQAEEEDLFIEEVFLPNVPEKVREVEFAPILGVVGEGTKITYLQEGDQLQSGTYRICCLHPGEGDQGESNALSLCLLVEVDVGSGGARRLLLTGDVEGTGEEQLTERLRAAEIGHVDLLKVAHHGSRFSTGEDFLRAVKVEAAIISCGAGNSYGHPHEETLERLCKNTNYILRTDEAGTLSVIFHKNGVGITGYSW